MNTLNDDKSIFEQVKEYLDRCTLMPLFCAFAFNMIAFYGANLVESHLQFHDLSTALDHMIPLMPIWIFVYYSAFLQWFIGYLDASHVSRAFSEEVFSAEIFAKIITFACFLIVPTMIVRPEVTGDGLAVWLTKFMYTIDRPTRLFPSIHCLASWFCVRVAWKSGRGAVWRYVMLVWTILVCASVVLVKQHFLIDIAGGIAIMELGFAMAKYEKLSGVFRYFERGWEKLRRAA